mgnify:CR=1 FL=1
MSIAIKLCVMKDDEELLTTGFEALRGEEVLVRGNQLGEVLRETALLFCNKGEVIPVPSFVAAVEVGPPLPTEIVATIEVY